MLFELRLEELQRAPVLKGDRADVRRVTEQLQNLELFLLGLAALGRLRPQQQGQLVSLQKRLLRLSTEVLFRLGERALAQSLVDERAAQVRRLLGNKAQDVLLLQELAHLYASIACRKQSIALLREAETLAAALGARKLVEVLAKELEQQQRKPDKARADPDRSSTCCRTF